MLSAKDPRLSSRANSKSHHRHHLAPTKVKERDDKTDPKAYPSAAAATKPRRELLSRPTGLDFYENNRVASLVASASHSCPKLTAKQKMDQLRARADDMERQIVQMRNQINRLDQRAYDLQAAAMEEVIASLQRAVNRLSRKIQNAEIRGQFSDLNDEQEALERAFGDDFDYEYLDDDDDDDEVDGYFDDDDDDEEFDGWY